MAIPLEMIIYTCPRCKGCTANLKPGEREFIYLCPAYTRYGYFAYSGGGKCYLAQGIIQGALEPDEELAEVLYHCTLCRSCSEQCSAEQDPTTVARLVRKEVVERLGFPPNEASTIVKSMLNYKNPYQQPKAMRDRWARGLRLKDAAKENVETLYYVGCTAAMVPGRVHFATNTVKILQSAGEDFGVLGKAEICCGSTTFNLGAEKVFGELASENIDLLNDIGVKRVLTSCAGCYSVMKNEYPKVKRMNFEVVHIVEYIDTLITEGKLKFVNEVGLSVTYHDPCHLGRYCGIYDSPRRILESIPGTTLKEMPRHREKSWCCGAGAGVKTAYPDFAQWVAGERLEEAIETGCDALISACPFCEGNLADAISAKGAEISLLDITGLVVKALAI